MISFKDVQENKEIIALVNSANHVLAVKGYTDHGPRHAKYVSRYASQILKELRYPERTVELAAIAGWVHDVGNSINRKHHGLTGANLIFPILRDIGMPIEEICLITSAIGNHEEETGIPVNEISSALIIADKIDAHKKRVRKKEFSYYDIHDRVNFAIHKTGIIINYSERCIKYDLKMDSTASIMDFLQIYSDRMLMCEKAAEYLNCSFEVIINDVKLNHHISGDELPASAKSV